MYLIQGSAHLLGIPHGLQGPLLRQRRVPAQAQEVLHVVVVVDPELLGNGLPVRLETDLLTHGVHPDLKRVSHSAPPHAGAALLTTASTCSRKVTHSSFRASRARPPFRVMR